MLTERERESIHAAFLKPQAPHRHWIGSCRFIFLFNSFFRLQGAHIETFKKILLRLRLHGHAGFDLTLLSPSFPGLGLDGGHLHLKVSKITSVNCVTYFSFISFTCFSNVFLIL